ncbi:hypothetical protein ACFFGV_14065 [Pontibacillus salicampi]|uniref:Uncharacterized protein n=1 Tax=Pontibacillus salicampi TaxID=1449801 RepID=A0ABV6LQZ9_9BACI
MDTKRKMRNSGIGAMIGGLLIFFIGMAAFNASVEPSLDTGFIILVSFLFVFAFGLCLTVVSAFYNK